MSPNGKYFVSASNDRSIKIFDIQNRQEVHHFQNIHEKGVTSLAFGRSGRLFYSGSTDQSIKIFDIHTKQQAHHFLNAHEGK